MAFRAARITVTTTATRLDTGPIGDNIAGSSIIARCPTVALFVGGADVTAATGYEVPAGEPIGGDLQESYASGDALYAVVATGTAVVHVLRSGV